SICCCRARLQRIMLQRVRPGCSLVKTLVAWYHVITKESYYSSRQNVLAITRVTKWMQPKLEGRLVGWTNIVQQISDLRNEVQGAIKANLEGSTCRILK